MRVTLLTLPFSPALGRFVDEPLRELLARAPATTMREHFFVVDELPYLLCVVTHAPGGARSSPAPAVTVPAEGAAPADEGNGAGRATPPVQELIQDFDDGQRRRFEAIRRWRAAKAHDEGAPPYVVLTNRQLVEVVRQRPDSRAGLGRIQGLGEKKLGRYGDELLQLLWGEAPADEPAAAAEEGA